MPLAWHCHKTFMGSTSNTFQTHRRLFKAVQHPKSQCYRSPLACSESLCSSPQIQALSSYQKGSPSPWPVPFWAGTVVCFSFVLLAWRTGEINFHHVAWLQLISKYQRAELTRESFKGHRARDTYTTLMSQRCPQEKKRNKNNAKEPR